MYAASANAVRVFTYTSATGWVQRGSDISVTMNNGDQFGARAKANGDVEVYKNGSPLGTVSVTAWAPYSGGGYIGLWYSNVSGAIVDDFGGGNVSSSPTATPTTTLTPTTTNTPTITSTASPTETMSNTPTITNTATITDTPTITLTPSNTSMPSHTPTVTFTPSQTFTPSFTPTLTNTPTFTPTPGQPPSGPVTITYEYDPLYRLTEANYSTGDYYHYTYDAVGNRLSQTTELAVTSYQYDVANRLTSVDGVNYTWDNNGNLLNDGVNSYTYDSANRLISFNGTSSYAYNGLGDRLSQSVNGQPTNYTLDLNAGLTQVLNDGTNTYLYGVGRISQVNATTDYFLTDALGSVRQLTNASGDITLAKRYDPYGSVAQSVGSGQSIYAYTGEQVDASGLTYLRARYYSSGDGRFLTRDTWMGEFNRPLSLNRWNYTNGNPINYTDPSGHCPRGWIPNPDGTCSFELFPSLLGGPVLVIQIPEGILSQLFCSDPTSIFQQANATPTVTPQPYTPTPGSVIITSTQIQTQVHVTQTPTLTPTPTKPPLKKHIALGISDYLGTFLGQLNMALLPLNAVAYISDSWQAVRLSDVPASMLAGTFHIAFQQAITRAERIHFNLQGISNPKEWAESYGKGDVYKDADYVTAWELYNIYYNPVALRKTTFYPDGFIPIP